ncbi:acyltransferase family protein [Romboutsia maritimum]|uniref:acyltransferase family protein n=1 Tax=Romboutsia maritimum TaxID=2020948 RepID=UPI0013148C38|nr:acyltransferase family protein [Romboutsia maritimum]
MILVYISMFFMILYDIKVLKYREYNLEPLSLKNSNVVKGLAAIVVVLHHISQRVYTLGSFFFFRYLGYLSVSLFLFYSGYGLMKSYNSKENYLNGFWINRMPKIIIPFILSNVLFITIYTLSGREFSVYDILTYILGIRLIDSFKWYIIVTIILYSGFYFMFKYLKRNKATVGIFLLITGYDLGCRILGMGGWWYSATYCFFIGILFGQYYKLIFSFIRKKYTIITLSILISFISTFALNIFKGNILISIVSSALFVLSCVCILMKLEIGNTIINLLGNISYEIYLVHRIILDGLDKINNEYIYMILCISISILIAYIFSIFVKKSIKIYQQC